jgi:acyl-CoA synthetase (AMP-forming)/AMP-acid ligase II
MTGPGKGDAGFGWRNIGDRVAGLLHGCDDTLRYADLEARSVQLGRLLREHGLVGGDRVAILMENNLDWFVALWGVRRTEMLAVPVNWHLRASEIRYVLENSDARAIIVGPETCALAADACAGPGAIVLRLIAGDARDGFAALDEAIRPFSGCAPADERDGGAMPYSSGTTGRPKGILRALTGMPFGTRTGLEDTLIALYGLDRDTVYLSPGPLYHSAPVAWTNAVQSVGGKVVVLSRFDAGDALAAIARHRVTHAQFVPTHFVRMLDLPIDQVAGHDLSSLKKVIHAAAPCPPKIKRAMIDWLGPIIHEYYSGSERCGFAAIDSHEWLLRPGSVGTCRNGAMHILDDAGRELPPGEIGQVWFDQPVPFAYHKDAAQSGQAINGRGWGSFGDLGHVDRDGYLFLADRRSDMILSGGVNIYPQEVENRLAEHPAVADVAVIGVPDPEYGQAVKAVVQLVQADTPPDPADLIAFVKAGIAGFKAPRSIDFIAAIPRHPNGKLLRRELRERYLAPPPTPPRDSAP